jgi:GWxTD domain-containing protein
VRRVRIIWVLLPVVVLSGCATSSLEKPSLDPTSQRFLDQIGYIITTQEEKIFREMPAQDRGEFIQDFWRRRDPTPDTEINEFREQYYTRLAVSDKAFQAGIPGWKTDRGRIYILLGPPTDVIRKAMGDTPTEFGESKRELSQNLLEEGTVNERASETWVYNQYPDYFSGPLRLVFVSYENTRDYKLITGVEVKPFSMLTYHQSDPNMTTYQWVGEIVRGESSAGFVPFLDYEVILGRVEKDRAGNASIGCSVRIPFRNITYGASSDGYSYNLELSFEVSHSAAKSSWRESRELKSSLAEQELKARIGEGQLMEQEVVMPLLDGSNDILVSLQDRIQQKKLRKLKVVTVR